jgi:heme/copper-type cytochrome/quinol oxidase subunit 1
MPGSAIVTPELYNFLVTAHGLVIIFFFLIPVLIRRFRNYLLPLYLQVPDIAIPRLNNLSF